MIAMKRPGRAARCTGPLGWLSALTVAVILAACGGDHAAEGDAGTIADAAVFADASAVRLDGGVADAAPPPWVEILSPAEGEEVPNPVTFEFATGNGVETVWFEVDGYPLQAEPIPASAGTHSFRFVGVDALRTLVLTGRNAQGEPTATDEVSFIPSSQLVTRCEVLHRAQAWVDDPNAWYSWDPTYTDPTTSICCYRPDCSGLVSAVWGLPPPGHTTYSFAEGPWDDGVSYVIPASDLKPGDALNYPGDPNAGTGHIMLYVSGDFWSGNVEVMEEYSYGHTAERRWRSINPSIYFPIRYVNIVDGDLTSCP